MRLKGLIVLIFCGMLGYKKLFAQNQVAIDSLRAVLKKELSTTQKISTLNKLVELYSYFDSTQTAYYFEQLRAETQLHPSDSLLSFAYFNYAWLMMDRGNFEKAELFFRAGKEYARKAGHLTYEGFGFQGLGMIHKRQGNYEQALNYYEKFLELEQKAKDEYATADAYNAIATVYASLLAYDKAIEFYRKGEKVFRKINNFGGLAYSLDNLANIYFYQGNYSKAIEYYFKALELDEKDTKNPQNKENISSKYHHLALVYDALENYPEALKNAHFALKSRQEIANKMWIASTSNLLGNIHQAQQNYDSAAFYLQRGLRLAQEANNQKEHYESLIGLGKLNFELKHPENAFHYAERALTLAQKMENRAVSYQAWHLLSKCYLSSKNYEKALSFAQKTYPIAQQKSAEILQESAGILAIIYEKQGNYQQAYAYHKIFKSMTDSLLSDKNRKLLTRSAMQYEFDKEKAKLQAQNEQQRLIEQQKLQRQKYLTYGIAIGFIFILIFTILIYRSFQQKKTAFKLLSIQKEEILHQKEEISQQKEEILQQNQYLEDTLKTLQDAQSQLIQSEKMASVGMLTASMAHEINNPINYISGGVQALEGLLEETWEILEKYAEIEQQSTPDLAQFRLELAELKEELEFYENKSFTFSTLKDIQAGAERMAQVVKSLRIFTRLDENEVKETDIHENLEAVLVILGNHYVGKIELVKDFASILSPIWCLPAKINQVFLNLLLNAEESLNGSGTITLQTSENEEFVIISIRDNGKGIPEDVRDSIFMPFFTTKESEKNTGLGLTMVQEIIQEHQGKIIVTSEEGKGTDFQVFLPKNV